MKSIFAAVILSCVAQFSLADIGHHATETSVSGAEATQIANLFPMKKASKLGGLLGHGQFQNYFISGGKATVNCLFAEPGGARCTLLSSPPSDGHSTPKKIGGPAADSIFNLYARGAPMGQPIRGLAAIKCVKKVSDTDFTCAVKVVEK